MVINSYASLSRILIIGMFFFTSADSADSENWDIKFLMKRLSEVKTAKLEFAETKRSILLFTDTTLKGEIEYRAPHYIEKITLFPFHERVIIDENSMVIEQFPSMGRQQEIILKHIYEVESYPALKAAVDGVRYMLSGNYAELIKNYEFNLSGNSADWEILLTPKSDELLSHVKNIYLYGHNIHITKIVTTKPDGDRTVLELFYKSLENYPAGS